MASSTLKGIGSTRKYDGSSLRIGIIHARWNETLISALLEGTRATLRAAGVSDPNIVVQSVPGSYELPLAAQRMYLASQQQHATASSGGGVLGSLSNAATDLLGGSTTDLPGTAAAAAAEKKSVPSGEDTSVETEGGSREPFDAIIAIGALIKGSTMHFEYISDAVSHGLMRVQVETGCPIVFGLLTLLDEEQGKERAGLVAGKSHNHGEDWGSAAVELGVKRRAWAEGRFVE